MPRRILQKIMDVNYMGVARISKDLVPCLRTYASVGYAFPTAALKLPRARLLAIISNGPRSNTPGFGDYSASKLPTASLLDTTRVELFPCEIDILILELSCVKTPLVASFELISKQNWKNVDEMTQWTYLLVLWIIGS
ncbi:hypothetical protein BGZ96_007655 [Linnemannia gamsii]|uniref:Uncharacterized protein n=1 Tax=Linnemannia gamsii TaxID=64522 RepID=A0ABQ7KFD6_9FUNG|nr:hypothetical protein BGZ96_007655 [Linnemannia gamsii]